MMRFSRKVHALTLTCAVLVLSFRATQAGEKEKFPDEVEKPLAELEKKAVELRSSSQMDEMKKTINEIADAAKLGDDVKKKLEAEARAVVEKSLNPWKEKLDEKLRPFLRQNVKESLELMAEWPAEMLIKSGFVPEPARLVEQDDWKNALKKVLAPEQLVALEKQAQERDQGREKEIREHLKPQLERMKKNYDLAFKAEATDAKTALGLTGDRAKKLDDLAVEFSKRGIEDIEKRLTEKMRGMDDNTFKQLTMARGERQFWGNMEERPDGTPDLEGWRKAFRESLSEDEQKRWETAATSRKDRQGKAMAMMMVSQVDSVVMMTATQREKLEPLAIKVMSATAQREWESYSSNPSYYFSKFNQDELKLILDEKQIEHWKESNGSGRGRRHGDDGDENGAEKPVEAKPGDAEQDEDTIFATYFHARDEVQRDRLAQGLRVKLEDIQRVVKPSEESIKRLEIAARGAAEHALDFWRPNFENWVRSSMRSVTAKTLKQRLAALSKDVNFGEQGTTQEQPIWSNAVADVLTAPQMETWMNEVNGRKNYRERARVLMILAELDQRYHLSLDQFQKLEPLLTEAVAEYAADFNRMFSGGGGDMPRYMVVLVAGIPDDKLKSILTPEQIEAWRAAYDTQFKGWWENIRSNHDARNRRVKKL